MIRNSVPVTRYLKAKCGIVEDWPARLECYEVAKSANEEESMLWRIYFTNVEYVNYTEKRQKGVIIMIGMQKGNKISFYADSDTSTMQWYDFCSLLSKIPKYAIPRIPKENVALQQEIIRYNDLHDAGNKWMVDILDKGIGYTKRIFGLCVVYICNSSLTFNIYDFHNGKRLLCWNRDDIGLSGCLNSLIFVEVKEPWHGGPGLLWMQYPTRQSAALQKQIHNFLYARPKECKTLSFIFADSAMSHAHIRDDTDPELSQTPYEDQLSDTLSSLNTPVSSQSASLSSESSHLSSGYYSDSSYGESVSSRSSQLPYPKVTSKYMSDKAKKDSPILKKPVVVSSSPIQATSPTISIDKHSHSSLQNAFIQREITPSPNIHRSLQNHVAIPPTKKSMIPKPPMSASIQCTSSSCHMPNTSSAKDPINSSSKQATGMTLAKLTQLSKNAFRKCSDIIATNLDVSEILPLLNSQGLLTEEDYQILSNNHITNRKRIQHLLYVLPRKEHRFLDKFMYCLHKTIEGTGHGDILEALVANYNEEVRKGSSVDMSSGYIKGYSYNASATAALPEGQTTEKTNNSYKYVKNICPEVSVMSKQQEISIAMLPDKKLDLLTTLNIKGYKITNHEADMLGAILLKTISLERFDISNTTLDVAKLYKINSSLRTISSLKVFILSDNGIDDKAADSIADVICSNCLIEKLNLSQNNLSSVGMLQIAIALSINKNITILDISNNFITSDNTEDLPTVLSQCLSLKTLNISQNLLKLISVLNFAQCFRRHPNLQSLDLSNNPISFFSAGEFIVDVILSINQELVNLNVSGRNIRPRYVKDYLSLPSNEKNPKIFTLQNLHLLQFSSINTVVTRSNFIKVTESCPVSDEDTISYYVDNTGGTFYNQYHNFALIIPPGAVSQGECIEIQATASRFGPYQVPNGFYPISSFFWFSAHYTFKVPVYIIMSHYAKVRSLEDIEHLYVLQTSACDSVTSGKKLMMNIVPKGVYFDYETGYCVLATNHFCSFCQAKNDTSIPEYLVASFCTYKDMAEVCFCPSSSECKKVIASQCAKKNATPDFRFIFYFSDGDELFISSDFSNIKGWFLSLYGKTQISLVDFKYWDIFKTIQELIQGEEFCLYPPRFTVQCEQIDPTIPLYFTLEISKRFKNKKIVSIGKFPLIRKATDYQSTALSDGLPSATVTAAVVTSLTTYTQSTFDTTMVSTPTELNHRAVAHLPVSSTTAGNTFVKQNVIIQGGINIYQPEKPHLGVEHNGGNFNSLKCFASDIERIDLTVILPYLVSYGLLTCKQQEYFTLIAYTPSDKKQNLCNILLRLDENDVKKFLQCLSETSDYEPHKQLLEKIQTNERSSQ